MSKLQNRLQELDDQNVKGKSCYDLAKKRIENGYNGNISILISECAAVVKNQAHESNFLDEHYAY
jgi:hypothetical protein